MIAEQIPEMSTRLTKTLVGTLRLEVDQYFVPKFDRATACVGLFARFLPDWYRASTLPSLVLVPATGDGD